MAQQTFNNGDGLNTVRSIINANATENETRHASVQADLATEVSRIDGLVNREREVSILTGASESPSIVSGGWSIFVMTYAGTRTLTLPAGNDGDLVTICNSGTSNKNVDIYPDGSETIDEKDDYHLKKNTKATFIFAEGNWWLVTDPVRTRFLVDALLEPPVAVWPGAAELPVGEAADVTPFTSGSGWDQNIVTLDIISGALPAGLSLDDDPESSTWSHIVGTPSTTGSGSAQIKSYNPAGSYTYTLNWTIAAPNGASEYLNSDDKYPVIRSNETDFDGINFTKVEGKTGSINSSYVFDDTTSNQVYSHFYPVPSEGFSYAYLIEHSSSSYWYAFKSNVAPADVVNGLDLADSLSSTGYELAASDSEEVTVDGVVYPVDNSLTWVTNQAYIDFGNDSSLNGFMSNNNAWSYGFRVTEAIPEDFLGRVMFARDSGNYYGFKYYNSTYGYVFFGSTTSNRSYAGDDSDIGSVAVGDWIIVTHDGAGTVKLYVNGSLKATDSLLSIYWASSTLADLEDIHFGRGVNSNSDLGSSDNRYQGHGFWQGLIEDLFICNGTELTSGDVTTINALSDITTWADYATDVTHAWALTETSGSSFANLKGSIDGTGRKVT